jgi:hypothetical protein
MIKIGIIVFLIAIIVIAPTLSLSTADAKSKSASSKAKNSILKQIGRAVEGDFSKVKMLNMTTTIAPKNVIVGVFNKTSGTPNPPTCKPDEILVSGKCQKKPPNPEPAANRTGVTVFDFAGDFVPNNKIHDALKADKPNQVFALGDLDYLSTLSTFKSEYKDLGLGDFNKQVDWVDANMKCLIGNHDTDEDGNSKIKAESHLLCGEYWYYKKADSKTLVLAFNSNNDDLSKVIDFFHKSLTNATRMDGVKNVDVISHKNCYTFPGSHHKVESAVKAVCDAVLKDIPQGVNVYFISAHNHNNAMTVPVVANGATTQKFVAGGGGKTKYQCGTGGDWNVCNTKDAFLRQIINNTNGQASFNFVDTSIPGKIIK